MDKVYRNERTITVIKPESGEKEEKIRVAAYCRVSTDKSDQINSFLTQMQYYTDYIKSNDKMVLADIYADEGITGTEVKKRDEFKRLLKDCKNRKIDRVLVKSVTRFARNSLECLEAIREMKLYGVSVLFENDNIDTEKMNSEMLLYIKSAFAQSEAMSCSRRMCLSVRMRMEEGTYKLACAPYGYKLENGELVVVPEEAERIKIIFELYNKGCGENQIVKYMNRHYADTRWTRGRIQYLLTNERYIGDMLLGKNYTPNILPLRHRLNKGQADKYYYENNHEAIISKETFDKVKATKAEKAKMFYDRPIDKRFFSNKLYCRKCGWRYKHILRNGEIFWQCSKKGLTEEVCGSPCYSERKIEGVFVNFYNKLRQNERIILDETISLFQQLKVKINRGNNEIMQIDKDLAILSSQHNMYASLYATGKFDERIYIEKTDVIKGKIAELKQRRIRLVQEDDEEKCIESLKELKRRLDTFPMTITEFDEMIYDAIVHKAEVGEDGQITFSLTGDLRLNIGADE